MKNAARILKEHFKIFAVILGVVMIIYLAGVIYYSSHFSPRTTLNGHKVGGQRASAVKELIEADLDAHKLVLKERNDQTEEIHGSDIDMVVNLGDSVETALKEQNQFLWFFPFFRNMTVTLQPDVTYDSVKLETILDGLDCMQEENMEAPVNAKIKLKNGKFVVVDETYGTTMIRENLFSAVKEALNTSVTVINLEEKGCYENPTIYGDGDVVKKALKTIKKLQNVVVTYDFEYTTETVDKTQINEWINISETMEISLDYEKVLDFVEELAKKYDTYATVRDFTNSYGKQIKIYYGAYGWKISQHKETQALIDVIEKGESVKREPEYLYTAVCRKEGNIDWDGTYAEVSIADQHMWFYKDGKRVLSTDIVTGDTTKNHDTPTGAYGILFKKRDTNLVGQDYNTPVRCWMPFDTNVGFHDADWRTSFGDDIYEGNGSHGCVNMPIYAAQRLYELIQVGDPVFVY